MTVSSTGMLGGLWHLSHLTFQRCAEKETSSVSIH